MDHREETTRNSVLNVTEDILGLERRLSALECSHRSLCNSHMELEDSHASLNVSYQVVLEGVLQLFGDFLRCVSSSEVPIGLRFVIQGGDNKGDVDGIAA